MSEAQSLQGAVGVPVFRVSTWSVLLRCLGIYIGQCTSAIASIA